MNMYIVHERRMNFFTVISTNQITELYSTVHVQLVICFVTLEPITIWFVKQFKGQFFWAWQNNNLVKAIARIFCLGGVWAPEAWASRGIRGYNLKNQVVEVHFSCTLSVILTLPLRLSGPLRCAMGCGCSHRTPACLRPCLYKAPTHEIQIHCIQVH